MDNIIAYIQADIRFNPFLLKNVCGKTVIEHTIDRIISSNLVDKVFIGLYNCKENSELLYLKYKYNKVNIELSFEDNVTKRMIQIIKTSKARYVLRVAGDQYNINMKDMDKIIINMVKNNYDFFMPDYWDGILSDVVKIDQLLNYKDDIFQYNRYYKFFNENKNKFKVLEYKQKFYPWKFYVGDNFQLDICKSVLTKNIDIGDFNKNLNKLFLRLLDNNCELYKNGWIKSILENKIIGYHGEVLPWLPYSIINFLEQRLKKDMTIFEYGSGNSTLWFAGKVNNLYSVEHDSVWYNNISKLVPNNVIYKYIPLEYGGLYCKEIAKHNNKFDVVIIDGRDRVNCCKNAVIALKENGIIIWDDTYRDYYSEGYQFLKSKGFKELIFKGIGPNRIKSGQTSVFYRDSNCFAI